MLNNARLYILLLGISLFVLVPIDTENGFNDIANKPIRDYLSQGIANATGQVTSLGVMRIVWSAYMSQYQLTLGLLLGAAATPYITSYFSRPRSALFALCCLAIPGRVFQLLSLARPYLWPLLFLGHQLVDAAEGVTNVVGPVLASEIAPAELRGRLGIIFPMGLSIAAVLGSILGLESVFGSDNLWPYAMVFCLALSVPALPLLFLLPDTPARLVFLTLSNQKEDDTQEEKAAKSLTFYQGSPENLASVRADAQALFQRSEQQVSGGWGSLREPAIRPQLKLAFAVTALYIPAPILIVYCQLMLTNVGISEEVAADATLGLKVLSMVVFLTCILIADRFSRRKQLLYGTALSLISFLLLVLFHGLSRWHGISGTVVPEASRSGCAYGFMGAMFLLQTGVNLGIRPLYWVIVPELFPF